jgi:energy-coupling factor transporter ATP-binding protein EcfA2
LQARQARARRRAIQYVHQDAGAALDPWWSIGRLLEEGLIVHGLRDPGVRQAKVASMLEAVGLDRSFAPRYVHELSGGQLRRVALARILLLEPRIVILDEPTSGLDLSVQATVLSLIADLRARLNLSYLLISHDLSVVERMCDRVAIMYLGGSSRPVPRAPCSRARAIPIRGPCLPRRRGSNRGDSWAVACSRVSRRTRARCRRVAPSARAARMRRRPALRSCLPSSRSIVTRRWPACAGGSSRHPPRPS